jgi:hypothetical protein
MARSKNYSVKATISAVDRFTTPLKALSSNIRSVTRGITGAVTGTMGRMTALAGALGVAFSAAKIKGYFDDYVSRAGEVGDMARQVGLSATALQELRFAAELSDVSLESFDSSMNIFVRYLGQARAGTGLLKTYLDKLPDGLRKSIIGAKSTEEAFGAVMGAMERMPKATDRAALAAAAFGRSGLVMTRMSEKGLAGLTELRKEAAEYGLVSDESGDAADDFGHTQIRLRYAMMGVQNAIGSALLPVLKPMVLDTIKWVKELKQSGRLAAVIDRIKLALMDAWSWIKANKDVAIEYAKIAFDGVIHAITWIRDNWSQILYYTKVIFALWVGAQVIGAIKGIAASIGLLCQAFAGLHAAASGGLAVLGAVGGTVAAASVAIAGLIVTVWKAVEAWNAWKDVQESERQSREIVQQTQDWVTRKNQERRAQGLPELPNTVEGRDLLYKQQRSLRLEARQKTDVGGQVTVKFDNAPPGLRVTSTTATNPAVPVKATVDTGTNSLALGVTQ